MEVIIEQLGTTNNVLERYKFDQHRVEFGRAFSNDVILSDEHVDPVHARLEFDDEGRLFIEDLDSVNGIRRPRHKQHVKRAEVTSGEVFLVGRSRVRIYTGTHPVPPAVKIRLTEVFLLWLGKPPVAVLMVVLFALVLTLQTWLSTIGEFRWSLVIERNVSQVMLFVVLAVAVYFLSVLFRRGGNFLAHLSLLVLVFLVTAALGAVNALAVFNVGDAWYPALEALESARGYLVLFLYLWSIFYLAFHVSLMRRTLIALAVVGVMFGLDHLPEEENQFFAQPQNIPLEPRMLPPGLLLREPLPPEAFGEQVEALFQEAGRARDKALEKRDEANENKQQATDDP